MKHEQLHNLGSPQNSFYSQIEAIQEAEIRRLVQVSNCQVLFSSVWTQRSIIMSC